MRAGATGLQSTRGVQRAVSRRFLSITARGVHSPSHSSRRHRDHMAAPQLNPPEAVPQAEAAWEWFNGLGAPKFWVSAGAR